MKIMNDDKNPEDFIDFRSEEDRALFAEAKLGHEAQMFLCSDLGRLLQGRAEAEIEAAKNELIRVPVHEVATIELLQFQAQVAEQFIRWIGEAIQNGHHAEQQLDELCEEDEP